MTTNHYHYSLAEVSLLPEKSRFVDFVHSPPTAKPYNHWLAKWDVSVASIVKNKKYEFSWHTQDLLQGSNTTLPV